MSRSVLSRSLEPLAASLWGLFIAWTVLLGVVWIGALDAGLDTKGIANEGLRQTAVVLIQSAVPAWLALAVGNIHLGLSRSNGLRTARRWLWILLGGSFAFGLLASRLLDLLKSLYLLLFGKPAIGFTVPFGQIRFFSESSGSALIKSSGALGPTLLDVPMGWALLWLILVVGARECVLWVWPRVSHLKASLAGALLVVVSMVNIEPLAQGWRWRWWFWYRDEFAVEANPQWAAYAALAFGLSWLLRDTQLGDLAQRRSRKPAIAFLIFNALLIATHLRLWLSPPVLPDAQMPL